MKSIENKKNEYKKLARAVLNGDKCRSDFDKVFETTFKKLVDFENRVRKHYADSENHPFLENIVKLHLHYNPAQQVIMDGTKLYRARIFTGKPNSDPSAVFKGFDEENSFVPPRASVKGLRANYEYQPALYAADDVSTAICELKPLKGQVVSVAEIIVNDELTIFYLADDNNTASVDGLTMEMLITKYLLGLLFSEPVSSSDRPIEYIATQYIAGYIRDIPLKHIDDAKAYYETLKDKWPGYVEQISQNYDGIAYKSRFSDGTNYCIYDYLKCKAISSKLYEITDSTVKWKSL